MKRFKVFVFMLFCVLLTSVSFGQEQAPLKQFHFDVSINNLKTEQQAEAIKSALSKVEGVANCELVLIEYELRFDCSNHDMNRFHIIDQMKAIVSENGAEIIHVKRTEK